MRDKFQGILNDCIMVPSLSHYLEWVQAMYCAGCDANTRKVSSMHGEQETTQRHSITYTGISTIRCRIETGFFISMH